MICICKINFLLLITGFIGCADSPNNDKALANSDTSNVHFKSLVPTPPVKPTDPKTNSIHTEARYTDAWGRSIKVYNSYPRGGGYNTSGEKDGYRIFWTGIVNESSATLKLSIQFPVDSFKTLASPGSYIKILVPPNTMRLDQQELTDYGLPDVKSILDKGFKKPSRLEIALKPKEAHYYYTILLFHEAQGMARAALIMKEQDLFYKISIEPHAPLMISCGRVVFND